MSDEQLPIVVRGHMPDGADHNWWLDPLRSYGPDGPIYSRACNRGDRVRGSKLLAAHEDRPCRQLACRPTKDAA